MVERVGEDHYPGATGPETEEGEEEWITRGPTLHGRENPPTGHPPHRLVLSWAPPHATDQPAKISQVSFDISAQDEWPFGPWVGLRLEHSRLEPDSEMFRSITFGWPAVLSGLKSLIERPDIFDPN